jgi:hypothetical protein
MEWEDKNTVGKGKDPSPEQGSSSGPSVSVEVRRSKGMILGLLKSVEPTDLRIATEDIEIERDCKATNSPLLCVHLEEDKGGATQSITLMSREGKRVTGSEVPSLKEVRFLESHIECPINYLVAHGRETGFHHFSVRGLVDFIRCLLPSTTTRSSVFVIKLAACETGRGMAHAVAEEAARQHLNLILLSSPLFLYNIPVLDIADFATVKNDVDLDTRKINYQNTLTTREDYEQCMCFGVLEAYRSLMVVLQALKPEQFGGRVSQPFQKLCDRINELKGVDSRDKLVIPKIGELDEKRRQRSGPLDGVNGACTSFVTALRNEIVAYVSFAFASKGDVKKLAGEASLIRLEPIVLDWFSGKLFTAGSLDALNPTMALIAELVQARQTEKYTVGQNKSAAAKRNKEREEAKKKVGASKESDLDPEVVKRAQEDKEDLSSFVERKDLRISGAGVGFPLWTFYLDVMKAIDSAAVGAQNRFLFASSAPVS